MKSNLVKHRTRAVLATLLCFFLNQFACIAAFAQDQPSASAGPGESLTNLNLASTSRTESMGTALSSPVNIIVNGASQSVLQTTLLTPAEKLAVFQVLSTGSQTITIGAAGNATSGHAVLTGTLPQSISELVIPKGVGITRDFAGNSSFNVAGMISNAGVFQAISSSTAVTSAVIAAQDIFNLAGAVITSINHVSAALDLSLMAANTISNAGIISSSGNLNLSAGQSITNSAGLSSAQQAIISAQGAVSLTANSIVNAGLIASTLSDINIATAEASTLSILNHGGVMQAMQGAINARASSNFAKANIDILGGDLISRELNIRSGNGAANVDVRDITGTVNVSAGEAHITAATPNLTLGTLELTGDPTFYNTGGSINLASVSGTSGNHLAFVASQDVIITGGTLNTTGSSNGGNLLIVAGANFVPPPALQNQQVDSDQTTTVTISGGSATGGAINLTGVTGINTQGSGNGNGGGVSMVAYSGSGSGSSLASGTITLSAPITTGGAGTGNSGSVLMLAGATSGTSITTGSISTSGGTGASSANGGTTGSITLRTATPALTGGNMTITSGTPSGGTFTGGTLQSAAISVTGALNTNASAAGGTFLHGQNAGAIELTAGTGIQIGTSTSSANVTTRGGGFSAGRTLTGTVSTGGNGGNVALQTLSGDIVVYGTIDTRGGNGQANTTTGNVSGANGGTGGNGGLVSFISPLSTASVFRSLSGNVTIVGDQNFNASGNTLLAAIITAGGDGGATSSGSSQAKGGTSGAGGPNPSATGSFSDASLNNNGILVRSSGFNATGSLITIAGTPGNTGTQQGTFGAPGSLSVTNNGQININGVIAAYGDPQNPASLNAPNAPILLNAGGSSVTVYGPTMAIGNSGPRSIYGGFGVVIIGSAGSSISSPTTYPDCLDLTSTSPNNDVTIAGDPTGFRVAPGAGVTAGGNGSTGGLLTSSQAQVFGINGNKISINGIKNNQDVSSGTFAGEGSITLVLSDGSTLVFSQNTGVAKLTTAQLVAALGIVSGTQTLQLGTDGTAVGGSFTITPSLIPASGEFCCLTIPANVTANVTFTTPLHAACCDVDHPTVVINGTLNFTGASGTLNADCDITGSGTIIATDLTITSSGPNGIGTCANPIDIVASMLTASATNGSVFLSDSVAVTIKDVMPGHTTSNSTPTTSGHFWYLTDTAGGTAISMEQTANPISTNHLALSAPNGSIGTSVAPILTTTQKLTVNSGNGSVFVNDSNSTNVDLVTCSCNSLTNAATGGSGVWYLSQTGGGSVTNVNGVTALNEITIVATGSTNGNLIQNGTALLTTTGGPNDFIHINMSGNTGVGTSTTPILTSTGSIAASGAKVYIADSHPGGVTLGTNLFVNSAGFTSSTGIYELTETGGGITILKDVTAPEHIFLTANSGASGDIQRIGPTAKLIAAGTGLTSYIALSASGTLGIGTCDTPVLLSTPNLTASAPNGSAYMTDDVSVRFVDTTLSSGLLINEASITEGGNHTYFLKDTGNGTAMYSTPGSTPVTAYAAAFWGPSGSVGNPGSHLFTTAAELTANGVEVWIDDSNETNVDLVTCDCNALTNRGFFDYSVTQTGGGSITIQNDVTVPAGSIYITAEGFPNGNILEGEGGGKFIASSGIVLTGQGGGCIGCPTNPVLVETPNLHAIAPNGNINVTNSYSGTQNNVLDAGLLLIDVASGDINLTTSASYLTLSTHGGNVIINATNPTNVTIGDYIDVCDNTSHTNFASGTYTVTASGGGSITLAGPVTASNGISLYVNGTTDGNVIQDGTGVLTTTEPDSYVEIVTNGSIGIGTGDAPVLTATPKLLLDAESTGSIYITNDSPGGVQLGNTTGPDYPTTVGRVFQLIETGGTVTIANNVVATDTNSFRRISITTTGDIVRTSGTLNAGDGDSDVVDLSADGTNGIGTCANPILIRSHVVTAAAPNGSSFVKDSLSVTIVDTGLLRNRVSLSDGHKYYLQSTEDESAGIQMDPSSTPIEGFHLVLVTDSSPIGSSTDPILTTAANLTASISGTEGAAYINNSNATNVNLIDCDCNALANQAPDKFSLLQSGGGSITIENNVTAGNEISLNAQGSTNSNIYEGTGGGKLVTTEPNSQVVLTGEGTGCIGCPTPIKVDTHYLNATAPNGQIQFTNVGTNGDFHFDTHSNLLLIVNPVGGSITGTFDASYFTLVADNGFVEVEATNPNGITIGDSTTCDGSTTYSNSAQSYYSVTETGGGPIRLAGDITAGQLIKLTATGTTNGNIIQDGTGVLTTTGDESNIVLSAAGTTGVGTCDAFVQVATDGLTLSAPNGSVFVHDSRSVLLDHNGSLENVTSTTSGHKFYLSGDGSISLANSAAAIAAFHMVLAAAGSVGTANQRIRTSAANLTANSTNGSVFVTSTNATNVNLVDCDCNSLSNFAGDKFDLLQSGGGSITIVNDVTALNNISLTATGSTDGNIFRGTGVLTTTGDESNIVLSAAGTSGIGECVNPIQIVTDRLTASAPNGSSFVWARSSVILVDTGVLRNQVSVSADNKYYLLSSLSGAGPASILMDDSASPIEAYHLALAVFEGNIGADAAHPIRTSAANLTISIFGQAAGSAFINDSNTENVNLVNCACDGLSNYVADNFNLVQSGGGSITIVNSVTAGNEINLNAQGSPNGNIIDGGGTLTTTGENSQIILTGQGTACIGCPSPIKVDTHYLNATAPNGQIQFTNIGSYPDFHFDIHSGVLVIVDPVGNNITGTFDSSYFTLVANNGFVDVVATNPNGVTIGDHYDCTGTTLYSNFAESTYKVTETGGGPIRLAGNITAGEKITLITTGTTDGNIIQDGSGVITTTEADSSVELSAAGTQGIGTCDTPILLNTPNLTASAPSGSSFVSDSSAVNLIDSGSLTNQVSTAAGSKYYLSTSSGSILAMTMDPSATAIAGNHLVLSAVGTIGRVGIIRTSAANLTANSSQGAIYIVDTNPTNVNLVDCDCGALKNSAPSVSGSYYLDQSGGGSITNVDGITALGQIYLKANAGTNSNIVQNGTGVLKITADGNILLEVGGTTGIGTCEAPLLVETTLLTASAPSGSVFITDSQAVTLIDFGGFQNRASQIASNKFYLTSTGSGDAIVMRNTTTSIDGYHVVLSAPNGSIGQSTETIRIAAPNITANAGNGSVFIDASHPTNVNLITCDCDSLSNGATASGGIFNLTQTGNGSITIVDGVTAGARISLTAQNSAGGNIVQNGTGVLKTTDANSRAVLSAAGQLGLGECDAPLLLDSPRLTASAPSGSVFLSNAAAVTLVDFEGLTNEASTAEGKKFYLSDSATGTAIAMGGNATPIAAFHLVLSAPNGSIGTDSENILTSAANLTAHSGNGSVFVDNSNSSNVNLINCDCNLLSNGATATTGTFNLKQSGDGSISIVDGVTAGAKISLRALGTNGGSIKQTGAGTLTTTGEGSNVVLSAASTDGIGTCDTPIDLNTPYVTASAPSGSVFLHAESSITIKDADSLTNKVGTSESNMYYLSGSGTGTAIAMHGEAHEIEGNWLALWAPNGSVGTSMTAPILTGVPNITANAGNGSVYIKDSSPRVAKVTCECNDLANAATGTFNLITSGGNDPVPAAKFVAAADEPLQVSLPKNIDLDFTFATLNVIARVPTDITPAPASSRDNAEVEADERKLTLPNSLLGRKPCGMMPGSRINNPTFDEAEIDRLTAEGIVVGAGTGGHFLKIDKGWVLLTPTSDMTIQTVEGTIQVPANSVVYVIETGDDTSVYDLHENQSGGVNVVSGNRRITMTPGMQLILSKVQTNDVENVSKNCRCVGYRHVQSDDVGNKIRAFRMDFSIPSALNSVVPLRQMVLSKDPRDQKLTAQVVKNAASLMQITAYRGPYKMPQE